MEAERAPSKTARSVPRPRLTSALCSVRAPVADRREVVRRGKGRWCGGGVCGGSDRADAWSTNCHAARASMFVAVPPAVCAKTWRGMRRAKKALGRAVLEPGWCSTATGKPRGAGDRPVRRDRVNQPVYVRLPGLRSCVF